MNCKICMKKFDKDIRQPIKISCNHTFCSDCLQDIKFRSEQNYECPLCQTPVELEQFNYSVLSILQGNSTSRDEIKKNFREIEETIKDISVKCEQKHQDIENKIDSLKSKIDERTNELISMIYARKDLLMQEADILQIDLKKKINSISDTKYINTTSSCENMNKSELEILKNKINQTKKLLQTNTTKLYRCDNLIWLQDDNEKETNIGKIINSDLEENYFAAEKLHKSNDFEKAIEYLNKVTDINDGFAEAHFLKGKCFENMNKRDKAIESYNKAIKSNHIKALNSKGFLISNKKEAKMLFEKALELNKNPVSDQELCNEGESYFGLNMHQYAIYSFEKAIELNPNNSQSIRYRGMCYEKLEKYKDILNALNNPSTGDDSDCPEKKINLKTF